MWCSSKQPHSSEGGIVCPAERPGWIPSERLMLRWRARPPFISTLAPRGSVGRPGAGAESLWPTWAGSCVYGILGSCPPLPDNQVSPRARKGGGPGGDDTRTP
jgi:hypothetical protein